MFMGPRTNLSFLGAQASLMKYSRVKKLMVITSTTLIIFNRMGRSTFPSSFSCSSSIVELLFIYQLIYGLINSTNYIINVNVEMRTIVREKNAQKLKVGESLAERSGGFDLS